MILHTTTGERFPHPDKTILPTAVDKGSSRQGQYIFPTTRSVTVTMGGVPPTPPMVTPLWGTDNVDIIWPGTSNVIMCFEIKSWPIRFVIYAREMNLHFQPGLRSAVMKTPF